MRVDRTVGAVAGERGTVRLRLSVLRWHGDSGKMQESCSLQIEVVQMHGVAF